MAIDSSSASGVELRGLLELGVALALHRCRGEPRPGLRLEPLLTEPLGGLEAGDLTLDRREQPLALGELPLDRPPLVGLVGDDLGLRRASAVETNLPLLDLAAEVLHLTQDARVLVRHPFDRVHPVEQVVERFRAEQHLESVPLAAVDVERDEPCRKVGLSTAQARLRDSQMARVRLQVGVDLVELDVGEVVRLDRMRELPVDRLDLFEHVLGLRLLRLDVRVSRGVLDRGQGNGHENRRQEREDRRRLALGRADYVVTFRSTPQDTPLGARSVTSGAP